MSHDISKVASSKRSRCIEIYESLGHIDGEVFELEAHDVLGRVAIVHGVRAEVITCDGDANESQKMYTYGNDIKGAIVAGDWVAVQGQRVTRVLPRRSALRRPDPNGKDVQVLAANLDLVLLVVPIDRGLNVRMLERFAVLAYDSGARPFVILTKSDRTQKAREISQEANLVVPGVDILTTSSRSGEGIEPLRRHLTRGVTAVMLGPSGAGKTSLLNALEGRNELTLNVSRAGEGRHATSTRRLYRLSSGGVLLDIPGIRLVDLLVGQDGIDETFADIIEIGKRCRFRDCSHRDDLGCAVVAAVTSRELSPQRYENWLLIKTEGAHQERRRRPDQMKTRQRKPKP